MENGNIVQSSTNSVINSISYYMKKIYVSLAGLFDNPIFKDSFYKNISYIILVTVLMIGLLVYIQMENGNVDKSLHINQPTKVVKEVELESFVGNQKEKYGIYGDYGNDKDYEKKNEDKYIDQSHIPHINYVKNKNDVYEKFSSSFCNKTNEKVGDSGSLFPREKECNKLGKNSCLSVDCCVWAKYKDENNNDTFMCKAGSKGDGVTFKFENGDKKSITDIDCYYYKGDNNGVGENCSILDS